MESCACVKRLRVRFAMSALAADAFFVHARLRLSRLSVLAVLHALIVEEVRESAVGTRSMARVRRAEGWVEAG